MQSLIKLISKLASSMSDVGHALASQYSQHGVVEDGKQVRSMPHTELGMILMQRGIASMVQAILNLPAGADGLHHLAERGSSGGKDEVVGLLSRIREAATNEQPVASIILPAMQQRDAR